MAEPKFKRGDQVTIKAPHLAGVAAEVLGPNDFESEGSYILRVTDSNHPSGHSAEGSLVMFPQEQLEPRTPAAQENKPAEIEL